MAVAASFIAGERLDILSLGGRDYVVGLLWKLPSGDNGKGGFKQVELDLDPAGAVYCVTDDGNEQAGYLLHDVGKDDHDPAKYMGLPSLAVTVLNSGVGDGVYILPVDDERSYVLCIDDGQIVADTDVVVRNAVNGIATDRAWNSAAELQELHEWEATELDPQALGSIKPAKESCVGKVGGGAKKGPGKLVFVLAVIVLATLALLYAKFKPDAEAVQAIEAQQKEETPEEALARYRTLTDSAVRGLTPPNFYQEFRNITQKAPAVVDGWSAKEIVCGESNADCLIQYENIGNTSPAELRRFLKAATGAAPDIALGGKAAVLRLPAVFTNALDDPYAPVPHADAQLTTLMEVMAAVRRVAKSKLTATGVGDIAGYSPKVPMENRMRLGRLTVQGPINELQDMVYALDHPGFYFSNIKVTKTEYTIEGRYVQHL